MKHSLKHLAGSTHCLIYISGKGVSGAQNFAYLWIALHKMPDLAQALHSQQVSIEEWGTVVLSGQGSPSDEEKQWVEAMFGLPEPLPTGDA